LERFDLHVHKTGETEEIYSGTHIPVWIAHIIRFDGSVIEQFVHGDKHVLCASPAMFSFDFDRDTETLHMDVRRKYFPVSLRYGDFPFRILVSEHETGLVLWTEPFTVASKQAESPERKSPKRKRNPPPAKPTFQLSSPELEHVVSAFKEKRLRSMIEKAVGHIEPPPPMCFSRSSSVTTCMFEPPALPVSIATSLKWVFV